MDLFDLRNDTKLICIVFLRRFELIHTSILILSEHTHTHTHARITYSYSVFWPRDQDEDHRPNKPLAGGCDALSI